MDCGSSVDDSCQGLRSIGDVTYPSMGTVPYNGNMKWFTAFLIYTAPIWVLLMSIAGILVIVKVSAVLLDRSRFSFQ